LHLGDAQAVTDGVDPGGETILEDGGCQVAEEVTKGVVGGDAVRQTQAQGAQPGFLGAAEGGQVLEACGTGQGGAEGDGQDIAQEVGDEAAIAGILEGGEVVDNIQAFAGAQRCSVKGVVGCREARARGLEGQPSKGLAAGEPLARGPLPYAQIPAILCLRKPWLCRSVKFFGPRTYSN